MRIEGLAFVEDDLSIWYISDNHLCTIRINGEGKRCLNNIDLWAHFGFSSDGQKILFTSRNKQELFYLEKDSFNYKKLAMVDKGDSINEFDFSPNQNFVSYSLYNKDGDCPLFLLDIKTNIIEKVGKDIACFTKIYWDRSQKILYYKTLSYDANGNNEKKNFFSWNIETKENKLVGDFEQIDTSLFYSGQQNNPYYLYSEDINSSGEKAYVSDGSVYLNNKEIVHFIGYDYKFRRGYQNPKWLPGNRYVIFEKEGNLYIVDYKTNKFDKLTNGSWPLWYIKETGVKDTR